MEQFISFIGVIALCVAAIWFDSPGWFGVAFVSGVSYLTLRGKRKGWVWPKRP